MSSLPYLSVILPAYNEIRRLPPTLVDVDRVLSAAGFGYEIIVVDDGSTDGTPRAVERMAEAIPRLKLVENPENLGKGGAVRRGMLEARGDIRLFMDTDNATTVDQFEKMRPHFEAGARVVIGSRRHPESEIKPQPWYREALGRLANLAVQAVNLPGIWDSQCGFKAFTREAAEEIFSRTRIERFGMDIEILALARALGYKIAEIPVRWTDHAGTTVYPSAYLKIFVENLIIRWTILTGGYALPGA